MNIFRKLIFYTIPAISVWIVIARMDTKISLYFDDLSFYLLLLASIFVLIPEIEKFLKSFSKIKFGNVELTISEEVENMKDTINLIAYENKIDINEGENKNSSYKNAYEACIAVEKEVISMYRELVKDSRIVSVAHALNTLLRREIIDYDMYRVIKSFLYIRNKLMHGHIELNDKLDKDIINSGTDIVKLLSHISLPQD